jgi:hypothetical protein
MGLKARVAIVPSDGDVFPVRCLDRPLVGLFAIKTNASADLYLFRLFARHWSWPSRNRTPTPFPPLARINSTLPSLRARCLS